MSENAPMTETIYVLLQQWSLFTPKDGEKTFETFMDFMVKQNEEGELS